MKIAFVEYLKNTCCKKKGKKEWVLAAFAERRASQGKVKILKYGNR